MHRPHIRGMDANARTHTHLRAGQRSGKARAAHAWGRAFDLEAQAADLDERGNPLLAQIYRLEADRIRARLQAA